MRSRFPLLVFLVSVASGCDYYAKPHRSLPDSFQVQTLEGGQLDVQAMHGKPWVINLWMPG